MKITVNMVKEVAAMYEMSTAEAKVLTKALELIKSKMVVSGKLLTSPCLVTSAAKVYFTLTHANKENEVFSVMYLDNQHRLIAIVDEFFGTIDGASVYTREIVKAAMKHNAAAVVLIHNHPSGIPEPSRADIEITNRITNALGLVDVRVLDHIVVGKDSTVSFAERGIL